MYNPSFFGKESYYDELARLQKIEMEKLEKQRRERTKVFFCLLSFLRLLLYMYIISTNV